MEHRVKPNIIVSETDSRRLTDLALGAQNRLPEISDELLMEMERAKIVAAGSIPGDVVQMGSTVAYEAEGGSMRRVTLVFPADANIDAGRISIMTPIGTALIGLSPGQSMTWRARDGKQHTLTIVSVEPPLPAEAEAQRG